MHAIVTGAGGAAAAGGFHSPAEALKTNGFASGFIFITVYLGLLGFLELRTYMCVDFD